MNYTINKTAFGFVLLVTTSINAQERVGSFLVGSTPEQIAAFEDGKTDFSDVDGVSDGLGPRFNGNSCSSCHAHPAIGGSSPPTNPQVAVATLLGGINVVPSFITSNGPVREVRFTSDGRVHDLYIISGRSDAVGCNISQPDFNVPISFRIPTPLFGLGLVENTSDAILQEDIAYVSERRLALGVSGHFNHLGEKVARFGWKSQHASLRDFSGEAYVIEMGVTNELFPVELDQDNGCQFNNVPESTGDIDRFTTFMSLLAPPTPVDPTPTTLHGKYIFYASGCNVCHIENHKTNNGIKYSPYSDFQVHKMGALSDSVSQGETAGDEFRTAPLWGIGQRLFFLHDGRTADLMTAIQLHASPNSEATASVALFNSSTDDDKKALISFLESL